MIIETRNFYTGVGNQNFFKNIITDEYFKLNYFREGLTDEEMFNNRIMIPLLCNNRNEFNYANNYIINNFQSNVNKYNHYYIIDGGYRKDFYFNTETQQFNSMKRGNISGSVNFKSCGIEDFKGLEMLVYRQPDRQFIGKYPVTEQGTYTIPNLDVNTKYDIVLFDTKLRIEKQVHSLREPKETTIPPISAARPYNLKMVENPLSYDITFNIDKAQYCDYEYCRLVYIGKDGRSYEILKDREFSRSFQISFLYGNVKYGFYKIESVYKDLVESSDLLEIKEPIIELINIVIPNDVYTPPTGDNINIVVGE